MPSTSPGATCKLMSSNSPARPRPWTESSAGALRPVGWCALAGGARALDGAGRGCAAARWVGGAGVQFAPDDLAHEVAPVDVGQPAGFDEVAVAQHRVAVGDGENL